MASKKALGVLALGVSGFGYYHFNYTNPENNVFSKLGMRVVQSMDPEEAHKFSVKCAALGIMPGKAYNANCREMEKDSSLSTTVWNREFSNPVGIAAGFDKNGDAIQGLFSMGFGFVEIGSVCPRPQPGNPKPRVFRLREDGAVINRYGFNSDGMESVEQRLADLGLQRNAEGKRSNANLETEMVGINLGKNKETKEAVDDYILGVKKFTKYADYLVINVSSPNTPNLRDLQHQKELRHLLSSVKNTRDEVIRNTSAKAYIPPILVKISPDLTSQERADIAKVALDVGIDGMIISNTTVSRPSTLINQDVARETGGLSGKPLFHASTQLLQEMYRLTGGKIPLIGVGGISSGKDAYEKIKSGASLVQLYSALTYEGPALVPKIKRELQELLARDGYKSVREAVGAYTKSGK